MKPFCALGSFLFGLISVAHLARAVFGWTVAVDAVEIPMWPSVVIFIGLGLLSVLMWREASAS